MKAIEFLKNKGITKATCYTDNRKTYYVNELAELIEEYAALRKHDVVGRSEQLSCGRNITTCVFYKDGGKCSNPEYCRDQTT